MEKPLPILCKIERGFFICWTVLTQINTDENYHLCVSAENLCPGYQMNGGKIDGICKRPEMP